MAALLFGFSSTVFADDNTIILPGTSAITSEWEANSQSKGYKITSLAWDNSKRYIAVGTNGVVRTSKNGIDWVTKFFNEPVELNSIIYDGKGFIAVGKEGVILKTTDGTNWIKCYSDSQKWFSKVSVGNNVYVAVGESIMYSTDGVSWNAAVIPSVSASREYTDIIFDGKCFLVCSADGKVISSSDGQNWGLNASVDSHILSGIVWNGDKYVLISGDTGEIFVSKDATHWEVSAKTQAGIRTAIMWDGTRFIVLGDLFRSSSTDNRVMLISSDGYNWKMKSLSVSKGSFLYNINYDGSTYYLYDQNSIYRSKDLSSWETEKQTAAHNNLTDAVWFSKTGSFYMIGGSSDGGLVVSKDGAVWEDVTDHIKSLFHSEYNLNSFIATEDRLYVYGSEWGNGWENVVLTSEDGMSWKKWKINFPVKTDYIADLLKESGKDPDFSKNKDFIKYYFGTPTYASGKFFVPFERTIFTKLENGMLTGEIAFNSILISEDGVRWEEENTITINDKLALEENQLVMLDGLVGNGSCYLIHGHINKKWTESDSSPVKDFFMVSTDLRDWKVTYMDGYFHCIFTANGAFILFDTSQYALFSVDGLNFKKVNTGNYRQSVNDVVWANGYYVAIGEDGLILKSTDGLAWNRDDNVFDNLKLYSISVSPTDAVIAAGSSILCFEAKPSTWAANDYYQAKQAGLVDTRPFQSLQGSITKEEMYAIATRLYEKLTGKRISPSPADTFIDNRYPEVLKAYSIGLLDKNSEKTFRPLEPVTKEEMANILYKVLLTSNMNVGTDNKWKIDFADAKEIDSYALEAVKFMNANGFINGNNQYIKPHEAISREIVIKIAQQLYERYRNE